MDGHKASILVVDDEFLVREMLRTILDQSGYHVVTVEDGVSALKYVRNFDPDLVLLDIMLPDINGYEVCQAIKERKESSCIPVIFITSLDDEFVFKESINIGLGVDYIQKPIRSAILLARVANILAMVQNRKQLTERNEQLHREIAERDRLDAVIKQFSDSVLIVDRQGSIVYANQACEKNSGYHPVELVGKQLSALQHVEPGNANCSEVLGLIQAGKEWHGSRHNRKKDGSLYLEETVILPLRDGNGKTTSHVVMKKDITEQRRLQSIAQSVNLMDNVGFAFSGIRHELGNPVNSLKMTLSVLSKKLEEFSSETIHDFLDRSQHEISRIEYLLKSLRSFSMFEQPVVESVAIRSFLEKFVFLHEKDLERERIKIQLEIASDVDAVHADKRALHQVLLNLMTNAVHGLEGRPEPKIRIQVSQESEELVCLSFEDSGCGISEKDQEMLFKPFYTTKPDGTGLGLSIVKKMLAEMSCSITVESREHHGTTFCILMPCGHL